MNAPLHLGKFETNIIEFDTNEALYRRCPIADHQPPYEKSKFFMAVRWEDILQGLSANRSKYATKLDVLWAVREENEADKKCTYEFKVGLVLETLSRYYPTTIDEKTKVHFVLKHTPINCNISHCDIVIQNTPEGITKNLKRDIRAFLATFFN